MANRKIEVAPGRRGVAVNDGRSVFDGGDVFVVTEREYGRLAHLIAKGDLIDRGATPESPTDQPTSSADAEAASMLPPITRWVEPFLDLQYGDLQINWQTFMLRRIGNWVECLIKFSAIAGDAGATGPVSPWLYWGPEFPSGFVPDGDVDGGIWVEGNSRSVNPHYGGDWGYEVDMDTATAGDPVYGTIPIRWNTVDSWPTTLPGPEPLADHALAKNTDIPQVMSQPASGQGASVIGIAGDKAVIGYGDWGANTGPVDVLLMDSSGDVVAAWPAFRTEATVLARALNGGATWVTSIDPIGNEVASLATNQGGVWRSVPVSVAGKPPLTHLWDVAQKADGSLYVCGIRSKTQAENGGSPVTGSTPTLAVVWKSTDNGATWTEDLTETQPVSNQCQFQGFVRAGDSLVVCGYNGVNATNATRSWVNTSGTWVQKPVTVPLIRAIWGEDESYIGASKVMSLDGSDTPVVTTVDPNIIGYDGTGWIRNVDGYFYREGSTVPFVKEKDVPAAWTSCVVTTDGAVWISIPNVAGHDNTIYRVPPQV